MSSVWITDRGEYSDYRIDKAFATEEAARAYIVARKTAGDDGYGSIHDDPWELEVLDECPPVYTRFTVAEHVTGDTEAAPGLSTTAEESPVQSSSYARHFGFRSSDYVAVSASAATEEAARKRFTEIRAQVIANWAIRRQMFK